MIVVGTGWGGGIWFPPARAPATRLPPEQDAGARARPEAPAEAFLAGRALPDRDVVLVPR